MATAEELRQMREQQSIFADLYDLVNQQNAQLAAEGRRPVLGGLLSKEPVEGVDTIRYEGIGNMLAGLLAPAAKAFDAPMAAAQGNIPREDMLSEALGTAGMAMLGGGAVAGKALSEFDPTVSRVFAGPKAKTADLDALKVAKELSARRRDPDDIFKETGWFKGADGRWRFEISDDKAQFIPDPTRVSGYELNRASGLGDVLSHPELYDAYPELKDILTQTYTDEKTYGGWQPFEDRSAEGFSNIEEMIMARGPDRRDLESTLLHEIDHAIANREGFSGGANQSDAVSRLLERQNIDLYNLEQRMEARQQELGLNPFDYRPDTTDPELLQLRSEYDAKVGRSPSNADIFAEYKANMGEVAARNVQSRRDMTPNERRSLPPRLTEDTPREAQWLAANASPIGGLLAQSGVSSEQAQRIEDYLQRTGLLQ